MILLRNNTPDAFARFISRGFIRYGIDLSVRDEAGMLPPHAAMLPPHKGARPIAAAPATATPQHSPARFERPMTSELVPTTALADAKEVTP
jgi:hypothetical protein